MPNFTGMPCHGSAAFPSNESAASPDAWKLRAARMSRLLSGLHWAPPRYFRALVHYNIQTGSSRSSLRQTFPTRSKSPAVAGIPSSAKSLSSHIAVRMPRWPRDTQTPATVGHNVVPPGCHAASPSAASGCLRRASFNPGNLGEICSSRSFLLHPTFLFSHR